MSAVASESEKKQPIEDDSLLGLFAESPSQANYFQPPAKQLKEPQENIKGKESAIPSTKAVCTSMGA